MTHLSGIIGGDLRLLLLDLLRPPLLLPVLPRVSLMSFLTGLSRLYVLCRMADDFAFRWISNNVSFEPHFTNSGGR